MIRDQAAYARMRVAEDDRRLSALSVAESLAIGEALWTSELSAGARTPEPRGENLARHLRITDERLAAAWAAFRT